MEREKDIERKLRVKVEQAGGWCLKFISSVSGVPDRICLFPGGIIAFVEMKRHGESPRPLQVHQIKRIRGLGFYVAVIDSEKGIRELMEHVKERGGGG